MFKQQLFNLTKVDGVIIGTPLDGQMELQVTFGELENYSISQSMQVLRKLILFCIKRFTNWKI